MLAWTEDENDEPDDAGDVVCVMTENGLPKPDDPVIMRVERAVLDADPLEKNDPEHLFNRLVSATSEWLRRVTAKQMGVSVEDLKYVEAPAPETLRMIKKGEEDPQ